MFEIIEAERWDCPFECGGAPLFDVYAADDEHPGARFLRITPGCCESMQAEIDWWGWDDATGWPIRTLLAEWGYDVVDSATDGTGYLVYRLSTRVMQGGDDWREACQVIEQHHSHHSPDVGWRFGVAVYCGDSPVGVATVGNAKSRVLYSRGYWEVTRLCTWGPDALRRNAASKLYAACVHEAKRRGIHQLVTYTLETENATSLKASNWTLTAKTKGGSWDRPSRRRSDKAPTCRKLRWEYHT